MLARARDKGYEFKMGLELEYFLVKQLDDGSIEIADRYDTLEKPCYDIAGLTRRYDFLTTVSKNCNDLGWGNYANDHEDANGQFEQNFTYDDALVSCDRAIFFRYMVHTLAEQAGMIATFMPKPFSTLTGNGCHFHMSLWEGETNLFLDESDPRGLGLSETAYNFIGGLKAHARATSALTAPTVNSYKRLKVGTTTSGATWSPVWISYGYNNRTQMLRIPGRGASRIARSTARATRTSRLRRSLLRDWTGSSRGSTPASRTRRTSTRSRSTSCARVGSRRFRRTCSWRRSSSRRTRFSVLVSGQRGTRTTSTTSSG